jgi:hypothetical protein
LKPFENWKRQILTTNLTAIKEHPFFSSSKLTHSHLERASGREREKEGESERERGKDR